MKNCESFMITRAKISAVRASGVRCLFEGGAYSRKYGMLKKLQVTEATKLVFYSETPMHRRHCNIGKFIERFLGDHEHIMSSTNFQKGTGMDSSRFLFGADKRLDGDGMFNIFYRSPVNVHMLVNWVVFKRLSKNQY